MLSGLKEERVEAAKVFKAGGFGDILTGQVVDKKHLIDDVRQALYASKICSYAQGMNLIHEMSIEKGWDLKLGELARIWKGGCIIRAVFLDWIKKAYDRNPDLANLLVDPEFAKEIIERQSDQQFSLLFCKFQTHTFPELRKKLAKKLMSVFKEGVLSLEKPEHLGRKWGSVRDFAIIRSVVLRGGDEGF
ncbi:6-phosphogluconate dehydrogenase [Populus alba x Populus x berolinensis]|nr:6-phosphogluconate dehydrogenase [Populus alba x Populus x berolinensis]